MQGPTASQEQWRVAISYAYPQAWKIFQVLSPPLIASRWILKTAEQSAEGCHALCKDPPPHKEQGRSQSPYANSQAMKTFRVLQLYFQASTVVF